MNSPTESATDTVEHILVIRFSSLGDILLTAPALRALRTRFPVSHIDLLVASEYQEAARLIPGPNRVLAFDRSQGFSELLRLRGKLSRCYHVVVDLQNNFRSAFLRTFLFPIMWVKARRYRLRRWLMIQFKWNLYREIRPVPVRYLDAVEMLGCHDDGQGLELAIESIQPRGTNDATDFDKLESSLYAVLSPGAKHFTKRWPAERWIELGQMLRESGRAVYVLGAASEHELVTNITGGIPQSIPVIGMPVQNVALILRHAQVAVTNDSGIMHLAAGVDTPLVSIFGSTVREFGFGPYTDKSIVIEHELPCRPCTPFGRSACPKGHFRCMNDTTAAMVFSKLQELIPTHNQPKT